jgi:hypothetical protein
MNEVLDHEIGSPAVTRARKKIGLSWRTVHVFAKLISASLRFMTTGNSASPRCTTYRHAYAEFRRSEPVIDAGPQSASDVFDEGQTRISSARHLRHGSGVLLTHSKTSIGQWCTGRFAGHAPRKIASADRDRGDPACRRSSDQASRSLAARLQGGAIRGRVCAFLTTRAEHPNTQAWGGEKT